MRFPAVAVFTLFAVALAVPAAAQDGPATLGYFMTVDDADIPNLEEGIRRHNRWHSQQGDPWVWQVWAAVTGPPEYVYISMGHKWADFDTPPVDLAADAVNWAQTGGPHTSTVYTEMWEDLMDISRPPATPPTMLQVVEFKMNPGGEEDFAYSARKFTEAAESTGWPVRFVWGAVVSGSQQTTHFVAVPMQNFAQFDLGGPEPPEVLVQAYGETEARAILNKFDGAMTFLSNRIWVLRPDLSYNLN